MSKITVKSEFLSDLRRFPVNTDITFKEFVETVSILYKLDNIRLKYRDEDGDSISITNSEELQEAFEFAKSNRNLLRVIVSIGPNSSLLESWIVVEKLPDEVREICNDIKTLSNQLRISRENVPIENETVEKGDSNSGETAKNANAPAVDNLSPTAAGYYNSLNNSNSTNQSNEESHAILSAQLPSWGKNSMYADDFVQELNNNNNNNNNNNLMEGERTDLMPPKKIKISQVVSDNSALIVKDLKT